NASPNNIVTQAYESKDYRNDIVVREESGNYDFTYEYNERGYPIRITRTGEASQRVATLEYIYAK
ncbi:MAG: hypothetical protein LBQ60_01400, partial [Bacteroidales bacterium]|nr:hypothetical protein [Bacteroidales bacterium]